MVLLVDSTLLHDYIAPLNFIYNVRGDLLVSHTSNSI